MSTPTEENKTYAAILVYCLDEWRTPTQIANVVMGRYSSSFASPKIKRLVAKGKLEKHPTKHGQYRTTKGVFS